MLSPKTELAAITRRAVETHTWDTFTSFEILRWNAAEAKLFPRLYVCIADDVAEDQYPAVMRNAAGDDGRQNPDEPAYAYLLTYELNTVGLSANASPAEHDRLAQMLARRTLGEHPDAREQVAAWCIDVHGRGWSASQYRDKPGVTAEAFHRPGTIPNELHLQGLLAVAYTTGMIGYGLPGPQQRFN